MALKRHSREDIQAFDFWDNYDEFRSLNNTECRKMSTFPKEIAQILISVLEKFDLDKVDFVPFDLLNALNKTRVKTDLTQIRTILKKDWNITNQKNSLSYRKFTVLSDGDIVLSDNKGRYFSVDKVFLMKNFDELMNNE